MVVFSDLDRSIIYSKRFLGENSKELEIEVYKGENISYISQKTVNLIKEINKNSCFIPTTTRTTEQFKRIEFSKYGLNFKYAITSNGGNILIDGDIDKDYKIFIEKKLELSSSIDDTIKLLEKYKSVYGIKKIRKAEEFFFYIVVDKEEFDLRSIEGFIREIKGLNWDTYKNGTKVYFVPSALKKSTAIKYICDKLNYKQTFAIGDSIMDKDMLEFCRSSYLLGHGDLVNILQKENPFLVSKKSGFEGTEEVLNSIILSQKNLNNNI
ncbi:HAD hydrolase family protein [Intestinibacter bartlettii]|uniref:HAD hydrolase family protein n=1 Tax=Intestinibacter bartlettii TaxID=261299 RepID=A0ABS6DYG3_9FIRM|nr:HAD hydrolase family protein [Intestinibacter bartlettii]MBU5336864.1 HAD hydrolase family protein [Intestinibacter bartlettii]